MTATSPRNFQPDGVVPSIRENQAPAISSATALARFEFESGKGNEGTKIFMVEWSDEDVGNKGDWQVSWEEKITILPARDGSDGKLHRIYFLLPPNTAIPRVIKLSRTGQATIQTTPLPAIFPPELSAATTQGRKGVLHTIWAKKRLSVLQKEKEAEMKNGEGIGLEMLLHEKQWIEEKFGVGARLSSDSQYPTSPWSPRSPTGYSRLGEELKGLKLGTNTLILEPSSGANPLSPDTGDVAVSSFSLFHGGATRPRAVVQKPPQEIVARQGAPFSSKAISLDAIAGGYVPKPVEDETEKETEDELFAVKLSPRSPEMKKSPFSFTAEDTAPWLAKERSKD